MITINMARSVIKLSSIPYCNYFSLLFVLNLSKIHQINVEASFINGNIHIQVRIILAMKFAFFIIMSIFIFFWLLILYKFPNDKFALS